MFGAISGALAEAHRLATVARACHDHAGRVEGDGEYTDGAIQDAVGITCSRALTLVEPRYHWIYAHWSQAYNTDFKLGNFDCHITPGGPNDLKICLDGSRYFEFV